MESSLVFLLKFYYGARSTDPSCKRQSTLKPRSTAGCQFNFLLLLHPLTTSLNQSLSPFRVTSLCVHCLFRDLEELARRQSLKIGMKFLFKIIYSIKSTNKCKTRLKIEEIEIEIECLSSQISINIGQWLVHDGPFFYLKFSFDFY